MGGPRFEDYKVTNPAAAVRITDNSGKALAGALVSFALVQGSANVAAPAQVLTDATGIASACVTIGRGSGPVTVTATALGVPTSFSIAVPGLAIYTGGIGGIGGRRARGDHDLARGALQHLRQNFVPDGTGRRATAKEIVNGVLPTTLLGVCVTVSGSKAPLLEITLAVSRRRLVRF